MIILIYGFSNNEIIDGCSNHQRGGTGTLSVVFPSWFFCLNQSAHHTPRTPDHREHFGVGTLPLVSSVHWDP